MPRSSKALAVVEEFDENEGDFDADDGSDDWQPEPEDDSKKGKRGVKRKTTSTRTSSAKKSKDDSDEEQSDEEEEVEEDGEGEGDYDAEELDEDELEDLDSSKNSSRKSAQKKNTSESDARNFPDRQGIFTLYAYKGDLKNGLRSNANICLWRRDGQSLLQKYMREKEGKGNSVHFSSTMVYSCWEDRRKEEYLEVRVKCLNNLSKDASRDSKVELLDVDTIEQTCIDEKFHELDLEPYVSFADRKKQEEALNGTQPVAAQEEEASEGEE